MNTHKMHVLVFDNGEDYEDNRQVPVLVVESQKEAVRLCKLFSDWWSGTYDLRSKNAEAFEECEYGFKPCRRCLPVDLRKLGLEDELDSYYWSSTSIYPYLFSRSISVRISE